MTQATRRTIVLAAAALAASSNAFAQQPSAALTLKHPPARTATPVKIGVIGSGRIGSVYGEIWSKAGHQVMFSDRDPAAAQAAAARSPGARTGTTQEAAAFGDVILLSVPYGAMPAIARDLGATLRGKVVIDTGNPQVGRDGEAVRPYIERGAGLSTASILPGARIVRAFNVLSFANAASESNRPGARVGIPVGGDDAQAVALVSRLVRDAGFDPVEVPGGLAGTKRFDLGPPLQGKAVTASEVRTLLGI
jgi:predicted dinucleotide-binding enzyme